MLAHSEINAENDSLIKEAVRFDNDRLDILSYRRQIPELYPEILSAMETYHLTACCSMPFYKITDLSEAWHMNEEAFALYALLQPEERRLFFFEEHITQIMNLHVLERTSGHPCIPACIRLIFPTSLNG